MSSPRTGVSLMWLLDGIASVPATGTRVEDLSLDSRAVRTGSLFFALRGRLSHGLEFAAAAVAAGASAVLWDPMEGGVGQPAIESHADVYMAPVPGLRRLIGRIADRFFGWPSSQLRIVGITGTNGKTTCAYLLAQSLARLNSDAAYIGTIGWGRIEALQTPTHTTADVVTVHRQLALLRAAGVRDVAMEVSSHALDQGRVDAVRFHAAAFTNLTRDHLDYHGSMQAYAAAKARLFTSDGLQHLIINWGDAFGQELVSTHAGRVPLTAVWVGNLKPTPPAERWLCATDLSHGAHGLAMQVAGTWGERRVGTQLMGRFNAENAVLVLGCLLALGVRMDDAAAAVECCKAPPGRMEVIEAPGGRKPTAVIDYAHTPDALRKALHALREHCQGQLWCVFGCGGDRDAGKRAIMGAIADELSDQIIITDDNPRNEDPESITRAIVSGIAVHPPCVIHDRDAAIAAALERAQVQDLVLIAGKGHEDYQIYGTARRRFSDRAVVRHHLGIAA